MPPKRDPTVLPASPDRPDPAHCPRCGRGFRPGIGMLLVGGERVHVRCLARATQIEARERQADTQAAHAPAPETLDQSTRLPGSGRQRPMCPVCQRPFVAGGGVLFQGDQLVHALCWRPEPPPVTPDAS
jgi:hypothetical protein